MTQKYNFMKYDFSDGKKYEIPAKIMHIKKFRLYCMKKAPNGEESAVTEHFFIQIGGNVVSEHERRQIGSGRIDWAESGWLGPFRAGAPAAQTREIR